MVLQWKPLAGEHATRKYYSCSRDVGHIGPDLMRAAMHALDPKFWEPWFIQYMDEQHITYAELVEGAGQLGHAFNAIIREVNPVEAMRATGFDEQPAAIQTAFYTKIGQVFLAAVWAGVKDLTKPGDDPPATFAEMMTQIDEGFSDLLNVKTSNDTGSGASGNNATAPGGNDPGPDTGPCP